MAEPAAIPQILVDGSSYLYRAFHALPSLNASSGQPTGAIKGVVSMLRRLQKDFPGHAVIVVFDAKGPTFRDEIYPQYKAHRPPMPDELRQQIEPLFAIIRAMGLPLVVHPGVEADDVIGTLAARADAAGCEVLISSGDKDLAQLVNPRVTLINTMNDSVLNEQGVVEKFGVPPGLVIDLLALMGDQVDNIPGVAGVGEKTALALLQNIGGLAALYDNLDAVADLPVRGARSLGGKLERERENAWLSYRLATIRCDLDLGLGDDSLAPLDPDQSRLLQLFTELEFKTWVAEIQADNDGQAESGDERLEYETILERKAFDAWMARLRGAPVFAFDTETTSLDYMSAELVGVSFTDSEGQGGYVPLAHDYEGAPEQLPLEYVLDSLRDLLESPELRIVGQNLKYDMSILARYGIELGGIAADTMLQSYVLDSTATRHDMNNLALKYLGRKTISFEEVAGKGAKQRSFNQVALDQAAPYAAEDADIALRLYRELDRRLAPEPALQKVLHGLELPLIPVLSRIERNGALLDRTMLEAQSAELAVKTDILEKRAHELAGEAFNLASPKQLATIMFEKLQLPVLKKTQKGAPSTAEEVLQELALDYPLPKVVLEYRGLAKLKSTYTDKLPVMIDTVTGRVHTSYHQAVTATGRLSSSNPNLQNIPVRTEEGRRIRQAFVAASGYRLLAADYSQIELRIMAHLSGDDGLCSAFAEGLDIHRATAAEVFAVALDEVSAEQRRRAKAINFGLIYGMSAFGLARQLGLGRPQAQQYIDVYFERYPGVQRYMETIREQARERGYVETLAGRRLHLPEINARNGMRRQAAERAAINAPMQGTAADIIKRAMINIDRYLLENDIDARIIMQVHDELVIEVAQDLVPEVRQKVTAMMAQAEKLRVPLIVDTGVGDNWEQAH